MKQKQFSIRLHPELYNKAKQKCKDEYGMSLTPLIKIFLKTFITQDGLGFFVGNVQLRKVINSWLEKKSMEKHRQGCAPLPGPKLREIYRI